MANFQVVIKQSLFSRTMLNVTNWQLATNTNTYLQAFVDALRLSYATDVAGFLANDWGLTSVVFRQMDGGSPFTVEVAPTLGTLNGTDGAEVLPTTVALLVSTIFVGGRPNRGRIYFPGLSETQQSNSNFVTAVEQAFGTMVEGWGNGLVVTGGNAFLRIARPNFLTNSWTLDNPVDSAIGRSNPATQRKRRLGSS